MRKYSLLIAMLLTLALSLPAAVQAQVVGRVTQVEGRVDLLKGGKLPATPAKVDESLQTGDVLRTKSLSRAQLTFMDNTVITVAPGSRLAIEEYMFDPAKGKRNAVLQLFQGLAHVVITKLFQVEQPDFIIKTHTAVLGVRGTELGVRLSPNASTILNFQGLTRVANIFPEVGDLRFKRAHKVAFSFGPGAVDLRDMQGTTVFAGLPPTMAFTVSPEDRKQFMSQVVTGLTSRKGGRDSGTGATAQASSGGGSSGDSAATGGGGGGDTTSFSTLASDTPLLSDTGTSTGTSTTAATNTVVNSTTAPTGTGGVTPPPPVINIPPTDTGGTTPPPPPVEPPPPPSPATYTFAAISNGLFQTSGGGTSSSVNGSGWGVRSGSWSTNPTYYTYTSSGSNTWVQGATFGASSTGTSQSLVTGVLTGIPGGTLTGPVTITSTDSYGQTFTASTTATLDQSSGTMSYNYTGALTGPWRTATVSRNVTSTPGTYFTQTLDGYMANSSLSPYNTQTATTDFFGGWAGGLRSGLPGSYSGSYSATLKGGTQSSINSIPLPDYTFLPQDYNDVSTAMQGVVSPGSGGTLVGALTVRPGNPDTQLVSTLPYLFYRSEIDKAIVSSITIQPSGSATGTVYETWFEDGRFASGVYTITQTPGSSPEPSSQSYGFSQTFNGAMYLNTGAPGTPANTLQTWANGWGRRVGEGVIPLPASYSPNEGYFAGYTQGTWAPGSDSPLPSAYGSIVLGLDGSLPGPATTMMSGTVSGVLGKTLSGDMTFFGSLLNGTSFSYRGDVTIDTDGDLTFNYKNSNGYSSTWLTLSGSSGTAQGTMWQWPGYHFTQDLSGSYTLTSSNGTNGTFSVSGTSGSRSVVYPTETIPSFSGNFDIYSSAGGLPTVSSGAVSLTAEGVVGTTQQGANSGNATYTLNVGSPLNITGAVPGFMSITSSGSSFNMGGLFVSPTLQINSANIITPGSTATLYTYLLNQTYNGFRLSTSSSPFTLASIEGYAWGKTTLTPEGTGTPALPGSYTPTGGYFVAQNLATVAAAPGVLTSNWLSVTGTMSARVTGAIGSTLTGNMDFTGYTSSGTTFSYQGNVSLSPDGKLVFNYSGTGKTINNQLFTQSGYIQQVPGTFFNETASGSYQQSTAPTDTGLPNMLATKDQTSLSGTRTMYPSGPSGPSTSVNTLSSFAASQTSTGTPTPTSGSINLDTKGVVAATSSGTQWGVASLTPTFTPTGSTEPITRPTINGPVTIGTDLKLTGQFVDQISGDKLARNLVSVTGTGQTTSSFVQTVTGNFSQTANIDPQYSGTMAYQTAPSLTGTSAGTLSGPVNGSYITANTAEVPGTLGTNAGNLTAFVVGVVGGPAGGVQTGVASTQMVRNITIGEGAGGVRMPRFEGTAILTPAAGSTPPVLTTTLNGVLNVSPFNGARVQTTGAVATTLKP